MIYPDNREFMAILFYKSQADLFMRQTVLEVDMSFKRVDDSKLNEIVFATYWDQHDGNNKSIQFCPNIAKTSLIY